MDKKTKDQVAAVMLLYGTPEQQREALEYCGIGRVSKTPHDIMLDLEGTTSEEVTMFRKYQSKPKQIEAVQFTEENKDSIFNSLTGRYCADFEDNKPILKVETVHGDVVIVRLGDWIVKDAKLGTYYPVKDDVFCAQYV